MSDVPYISIPTLAEATGKSRSTVSRVINKAVAAGELDEPIVHARSKYIPLASAYEHFAPDEPSMFDGLPTRTLEQLRTEPTRLWLNVPFEEKDDAKALGARFDRTTRRWYATKANAHALARWFDESPLPHTLPGEDRTFGGGLAIEPIPRTARRNVRTSVSPTDWMRIAHMVRERAAYTCELCGDNNATLHTHERFSFDLNTGVQKLERLVASCELCHAATHPGNTDARTGHALHAAQQHMQRVLNIDGAELQQQWRDADALATRRATRPWALDLSILTAAGITLVDATPAVVEGGAIVTAPTPTDDAEPTAAAAAPEPPTPPSPAADAPTPSAAPDPDDDEISIDPDELPDLDLDVDLPDVDDADEPSVEQPTEQLPAALPSSGPDTPTRFPWDPAPTAAPSVSRELLALERVASAITPPELHASIDWACRPLHTRLLRRRR